MEKSIVRVSKTENYVVLDKEFLNNEELSWKAKGLLAYMLSKPDNWTFYVSELERRATDGRDSLRSGIKELQNHGFIIRKRTQDKKGRITWVMTVHEKSKNPSTENPSTENPSTENPSTENPQLLNNNSLNNNSLNNNKEEPLSKIKDLLSVFSKDIDNFEELNDSYWEVIKETRVTKRISPSVIARNMEAWRKYDPRVVEYALREHIANHKGKREEYTLGIMRRAKPEQKSKKTVRVARF